MTPAFLAFILLGFGVLMLAAELLLPTHGLLGVLGLLSFLAAIGACFFISPYLGAGVFLLSVLASPFIATAIMNIWPRTPVGRKLVLPPVEKPIEAPPVYIGQTGVAVGQLRPMGQCDFGDTRLEAQSEYGVIEPGETVSIVALVNGRATVRKVNTQAKKTFSESATSTT